MRLERAGAATTVARQAGVGKPYKSKKSKTAKQEWHAKPDEAFRNNSVLYWGRYCRISQFPTTFPVGRLTAKYQ
eukprot:2695026-Pleurochrysis_carterae.AAC.1